MNEPFNTPMPPPPPPRKSRTGLTAAIVAGVLVLCLCAAAATAVIYFERNNLPVISGLFATPTPTGVAYTSPALGISLYYPAGWVLQEGSGSVIFASSLETLNSTTTVTGALIEFFVSPTSDLNLPSGVDASSPQSILGSYKDQALASGAQTLQDMRTYSLGPYQAASMVLLLDTGQTLRVATYLTVFVRQGDLILAAGVTPENEWARYQPVFDQILQTLSLGN